MEPCQIQQTHRPPRLGFIIPDSIEKLISYIKLISASAGGIYNFILPYRDRDNFKKWERYLHPGLQDYLFYDDEIPEGNRIKWREWPGFDKRFVLEYKDYPESYLAFIDVAPFHQEWDYVPEKLKDKNNLIYLDDVDDKNLFPLVLFGDLPGHLTFPFQKSWQQLGATPYKFIWEEYLNPFDKPKNVGPLQFSRFFLNTRGNLDPYGIFYIGNPHALDDLFEFWNLRALGHKIIFIPTDLTNEAYLDFRKWDGILTPRYRYVKPEMRDWHRPNIIFGSEIRNKSEETKEVIDGVKERLGTPIRITEPVFRYNPHDLYPRARFVYFSEDRCPGFGSAQEIKSVSKAPFPNHDLPHNQKWLVNFSTSSSFDRECCPVKLPNLSIETEKNLFKDTYWRAELIHISDGCLSIIGQFDNFECHLPKISVLQIASAIVDSKGYEATLSKPGNNVTLILKTLGGLRSGRILKIKGVRDVIAAANRDRFIESDLVEMFTEDPPVAEKLISENNLNQDSLRGYFKKVLSRYHSKIVNEEFTGINLYTALKLIENGMEDTKGMCIAPYKPANGQQFILEQMVENNIIELGFNYECARKHTCWYAIDKLSEAIECRICGEKNKIINPDREIKWAYQTKGMFRLKNDADGSISVILALWRLMHSLPDVAFTPSIDLKKKASKERPFEIDYIIHLENWDKNEPKLILGEAKSLNSLQERDMDSMGKALEIFSELNPAVCFSSLKENFADSEINLIKEFRKKNPNIEILTFVRKQLDVYDLHECGITEYGLKRLAQELYKINIDGNQPSGKKELRS